MRKNPKAEGRKLQFERSLGGCTEANGGQLQFDGSLGGRRSDGSLGGSGSRALEGLAKPGAGNIDNSSLEWLLYL
jgi:hypothetical protein